ncbi:MAG: hypothetical protein U5Q03_12930 [Bacteroidota bacterium]|nr:hypothetical protein [Bacteroidota bacterium]
MNRIILFFIFVIPALYLQAQDIEYARESIKTLASEKMHGRGYVKKGIEKRPGSSGRNLKKPALKASEIIISRSSAYRSTAFPEK